MTRAAGSTVIAVTETWIQDDVHAMPELLAKYSWYRQHRVDGRQGGGAMILVDANITQWQANWSISTENIQAVSCIMKPTRNTLTVFCGYRAPSACTAEDELLLRTLEAMAEEGTEMVLMGDFNFPSINWDTEHALERTRGECFLEWLHGSFLHQHVKNHTRYRESQRPSLLDLLNTRYPNAISEPLLKDPLGKSDHAVMTACISGPG